MCNPTCVLVTFHVTAEIACPSSFLVQKILIRDGIDDEVRSNLDGPVRATKMYEHKIHRMWIFLIGYLQMV